MSFDYCPLCGGPGLVPMDCPNRFACMRCRHVLEIVDVIAAAQAKAAAGQAVLYVHSDEELDRMEAANPATLPPDRDPQETLMRLWADEAALTESELTSAVRRPDRPSDNKGVRS